MLTPGFGKRRTAVALAVLLALVALGWTVVWRSEASGHASKALHQARRFMEQWEALPSVPGARSHPRHGGLDVTFVVTADTHYGWTPGQRWREASVGAMNGLVGKRYPLERAGVVGTLSGVLVAGDLTEDGSPEEWAAFVDAFGRTGREGRLRVPVYETLGNHDWNHGRFVLEQIRERHGAEHYRIDWGDLQVLCLGEAPGHETLIWLRDELASIGLERPIILYQHYPLLGPYSENNWFGAATFRDQLASALEGFNVVGVFHGHYHASGAYRWHERDVYNVGSVKYGYRSFVVVRVTDDRMTVASWNYEHRRWWWWHDKPINGSTQPKAVLALDVLPTDHHPVLESRATF